MRFKIVEIALFALCGLSCFLLAATGETLSFKGGLISFWATAIIGLLFFVVAAIKVRNLGKQEKQLEDTSQTDEELAADLARQEQLYFEEHGETPAETTARLLKEKQERKERKSKKSR